MKARNRDINIFNLSMLDVICGALGAFLILFLIAAPYHGNTSTQPQTNPLNNQLLVMTQWESRDADVNMWIYGPDKTWTGPEGATLFDTIRPAATIVNEKASAQNPSYVYVERYRETGPQLTEGNYVVVAQLAKAPPGGGGVEVRVTPIVNVLEPPWQITAPMRSFTLRPGELQVTALVHLSGVGKSVVYRVGETWTTRGTWPTRTSSIINELATGR